MRFWRLGTFVVGLAALTAVSTVALSQTPAPAIPAIEAPRDAAYPGTIVLQVDATDVNRAIFRVREHVPVAAGQPLTLLFPRWMPGDHSPSGEIEKFTGLQITANGQPVTWRRDPVEIAAFHVDTPAGASALDLTFQFVSATDDAQGRVVMTPEMLNLQWGSVLLYPAGYYVSRITFSPSVTLPESWQFATALEHDASRGATTQFHPVDLSTLIDSPIFAGRYYRRIDLDPGGRSPVFLNLFGDRPDQIAASDAQILPHRRMVQQLDRLFGARHFNHYDFLLAMSERLGGIGLEHHRESENATGEEYFTDWDNYSYERDLLPHEMTHSWNGKYRRPADLWTANYNVPMRNSLLWVYEGQTQYWGEVVAARSGLLTREEQLDSFARTAAMYENRVGHVWRPLEDTTNDPIIADRPPQAWRSWQRSEDYYSEGLLIWLDADTLIREHTGGRKSLDDFARAFFGGHDGEWNEVTYTFDDIVHGLNAVMPYDWASFLHERLDRTREHAPLDGITRGGYRLVYVEERPPFQKAYETRRKRNEFIYSLGLSVDKDGVVDEVQWDGPAFNQGVARGAKLLAVNGLSYDADGLRRAITDAKTNTQPITLLLQTGDHFRTVAIDYHGGLRYPHLERVPGTPDRLSQILSPRGR